MRGNDWKTWMREALTPVFFLVFLTIVANAQILTCLSSCTYNFEDNIGYAYKIAAIGDSLSQWLITGQNPLPLVVHAGVQIVSPLQEFLGGFLYMLTHVSPLLIVNIVILGNYILATYFGYRLGRYLTNSSDAGMVSGVFFGLSSLAIYATWYNLAGFCFMPALLLYLLMYYENPQIHILLFVSVFAFLLFASSTYYAPFALIAWTALTLRERHVNRRLVATLLAICIGSLLAAALYVAPIYFSNTFDSVKGYVAGSALDEGGKDIVEIFRTNSFNPITQHVYNRELPGAPYFRYSTYFGLSALLLMVVGLYQMVVRRESLWTVPIILGLIGLILFAGDELVIYGIHTHIPLPMKLVHAFHFGNIIRKSAYFFHVITLAGSMIAAYVIARLPSEKRTLLALAVAALLVSENMTSLSRPVIFITDRSVLFSHIDSSFIGLPNTGYAMNSFRLDAKRYGVPEPFLYADSFAVEILTKERAKNGLGPPTGILPYKTQPMYFSGNCMLDALLSGKGDTICGNPDSDISNMIQLGVRQIVLYKHYVSDFFFMCDITCTGYQTTSSVLHRYPEYFKLLYTDSQGEVYNVIHPASQNLQ